MQQTWRIIPWSSPIFRACIEGDIQTVKELFSGREASVWDICESGKTPLHVRTPTLSISELGFVLRDSNSQSTPPTDITQISVGFCLKQGHSGKLIGEICTVLRVKFERKLTTPPKMVVLLPFPLTIILEPHRVCK